MHHPALLRAIGGFRRQHPRVRFALAGGHCTDILGDMRRQGVDLGLVSLPVDAAELTHRLLARMPMAVYAQASFDADPAQASWVDYDDPRPQSGWAALDLYRARMKLDGPVVVQADSSARLAELVAHGVGLGFLPCTLADADARLRRVPLAEPAPELPLHLVLHHPARTMAVLQRFVGLLEQAERGIDPAPEPLP